MTFVPILDMPSHEKLPPVLWSYSCSNKNIRGKTFPKLISRKQKRIRGGGPSTTVPWKDTPPDVQNSSQDELIWFCCLALRQSLSV